MPKGYWAASQRQRSVCRKPEIFQQFMKEATARNDLRGVYNSQMW